MARILDDPENDKLDMPRSTLFDAPPAGGASGDSSTGSAEPVVGETDLDGSDAVGSTSDVQEMRDAE